MRVGEGGGGEERGAAGEIRYWKWRWKQWES